jgi:bifunctional non-homologous end joining protein LigD
VLDSEGIPRFELLQRFQSDRKGELLFFVFDLLYLNGEDLMQVPLVGRRELLKQLLPNDGLVRFSDAVEEQGKEFFRVVQEKPECSRRL